MSLLTTCPGCKSRFQVTQAQLQVYHGKVRCGVCKTVFNAVEQGEATARPAATMETASPAHTPLPMQRFLRESPAESPAAAPSAAPAKSAPARETPVARVPVPGGVPAEDLPPILMHAIRPRGRLQVLQGGAAVLLVLLLALQAMAYNRNYLSARFSGLGAVIGAVCQKLGCQVGLMQAPDQLLLETATFEAVAGHPDVYELNAALQNQADFRQEYPWLELTLTNEADRPIGRRVFRPAEYVPHGAGIAAGMQPHSETDVKLLIQLNHLTAAGYHVYLFFPPVSR